MSAGLEIPQDETKLKKSSAAKQDNRQCVDVNNETPRRQLEADFHKELKEIMEAKEVSQTQMVMN